MSTRLEVGVARALDRMEGFRCECAAIEEPHRKRDCGPMWHAQSWHGVPLYAVATVTDANERYPRVCTVCATVQGKPNAHGDCVWIVEADREAARLTERKETGWEQIERLSRGLG